MAEFFYWRYRLRLAGAGSLNAATPGAEIEGALLRDRKGGHACLQPWPSLGQGSLDHALEQLRQGAGSTLLAAAQRCMALDGAARAAGIELFDGKSIPRSHLSVPDWAGIPWLEEKFSEGFRIFKLKCGRDLPAEAARIDQLCRHFGEPLQLRLDFNECLDPAGVRELVDWLGTRLSQVEFIEDPMPFDERRWAELSAELPVDLAVDRAGSEARGGFQVKVIKPAWESVQDCPTRAVFTSAMDSTRSDSYLPPTRQLSTRGNWRLAAC